MTVKASALGRFKTTYKTSSGLLLPAIERHVMRSLAGGDNPERSVDWLHPSDMCKPEWCGRHDYYKMTGAKVDRKVQQNPSFRMENVFAEGHAIHGKYQTWLWEMGCLLGMFRCKDCGHYWFAQSPLECQFCKGTRLEYKEYPLRRERLRVEGHADAAVALPDLRSLVEIKSIGIRTLAFEAPRLYNRYLDGEKAEDIWLSITHPFGSHMRQGQLYLWMSWPVYDQIVFIYESKFHQQTKEFVVDYNKSLIAPILEQAKEVAQGFRARIEPDRPAWATGPTGKNCASCVYRSTCWSIHGDSKEAAPEQGPGVKRAPLAKRKRALRQAPIG